MSLINTEVCFLNNQRKLEFKIINFYEKSTVKNDKISSTEIFLGTSRCSRWRLEVLPNNENFLSIQLRSLNTEVFYVDFKISIKNLFGEEKYQMQSFKKFYADHDFGFSQFIDRETLFKESENLINHGTLKIICEINVYEDNKFIMPPLNAYSSEFKNLIQNRHFTDITLEIKNYKIKTHKLVLAEHSPVFHKMLTGSDKKLKNIKITDFDAQTVRDMIEFMYTDNVTEILNKVDNVYSIAKRYELERLIKVCEKSFYYNLNLDNAIQTLITAESENLEELEANTITYVVEKIAEVIVKPEWETRIVANPRLLRLIFECWIRKLDDGFSRYQDSPVFRFPNSSQMIADQSIVDGEVSSDFLSLFESKSFTDVTFVVEDVEIQAHRNILACRSPVFASMFSNEVDSTKPLDIKDTDYETFLEVLKFVYSGQVFNIENIALKLFEAAVKYKLSKLSKICEEYLKDNVTVENCTEILIMAKKHNAEHLVKDITVFVGTNILDIISTEKWIEKIEENPKILNEIFLKWIELREVKFRKRKRIASSSSDSDVIMDDSDNDSDEKKKVKVNSKENQSDKERKLLSMDIFGRSPVKEEPLSQANDSSDTVNPANILNQPNQNEIVSPVTQQETRTQNDSSTSLPDYISPSASKKSDSPKDSDCLSKYCKQRKL